MKKPFRTGSICTVSVLVIILGAVLFNVFTSKEPEYGGKKLSAWLDEIIALNYPINLDTNTAPSRAVRAIGTNAIPWLLDEMRTEGGRGFAWLNDELKKLPFIKYRFPDADRRLRRATHGFQTLGELAKPAIPDLLSLVEHSPGYVPSALAGIGRNAIPALQQCLTNTRAYASSVGQIVPIPGNTIGAIHNEINIGHLLKEDAAIFLPAIRSWSRSTNRNQAQYDYAAGFLQEFDH